MKEANGEDSSGKEATVIPVSDELYASPDHRLILTVLFALMPALSPPLHSFPFLATLYNGDFIPMCIAVVGRQMSAW